MSDPGCRLLLLNRALWLEYTTLGWNVVAAVVVTLAALAAHSVALAGFGLDSVIEILASLTVVWQLKGTSRQREQRALRVIGLAFFGSSPLHRGAEHPRTHGRKTPRGIIGGQTRLLPWLSFITGLGRELRRQNVLEVKCQVYDSVAK